MKRAIIACLYRSILKPYLFKKDPSDVHDMFIKMGKRFSKSCVIKGLMRMSFLYKNKKYLGQEIDGVYFDNPVGLSAGFDKEADLIDLLPAIGFGFLQIGSISLKPYGGNPGKRVVRLKKSRGIIVNYGLKNKGIEEIAPRIPNQGKCQIPISVSIVRTNSPTTADIENGLEDNIACIRRSEELNLGDIYTINISCPNTADGEPFSTLENMDKLLSRIDALQITKPLYLKMPIDKPWEDFEALLDIIDKHKVEGLVIGNLLKDRSDPSIIDPIEEGQKGGISGKPCEKTCNALIAKTYAKYKNRFTIIGAGGIFSAEDAYEKIKLGSSLVQLITGMIFEGPQVVSQINKGLVKLAKKDGYANISQAIGAYHQDK